MHHHRQRAEREASENPGRRTPAWFTIDQKLRRLGWDEAVRQTKLGPCWEWRGNTDRKGYGRIADKDRQMRLAHRVAYREWKGELDAALHVCHRCDNPPCINPDHLFQGDQHINMSDAAGKDRTPYGERHGAHRLRESEVRVIKAEYRLGMTTYKQFAEEYGVSVASIGKIIRGQTWVRV